MEPYEKAYIPDINELSSILTNAPVKPSITCSQPKQNSQPETEVEMECQYRPIMKILEPEPEAKPEANYNTAEIDEILKIERQKIVTFDDTANNNKKSAEKQKLILSLAVAITGPNVLKDSVISIGLYAGLSNGATITQQKWRFPMHETNIMGHTTVDNGTENGTDNETDNGGENKDIIIDGDDTKSPERCFNKTMWMVYWRKVPDIVRILQTDVVSKASGWQHFALTMDSFHVEYPPSKYDIYIICSMYTDVPFIDAGMYNFVRHASLWETFNPMLRNVAVLDIGSLIASASDEKKQTLSSCIDAITPYDGLPETDAERSFNAYLILNN